MVIIFNGPLAKPTRRALRRPLTPAEKLLWYRLRDRRLFKYKFRRQYSVSRLVLDFYCPEYRLAIEIDGDSHFTANAREYDAVRQDYIEAVGIRMLRFTNDEVHEQLDEVLAAIMQHLTRSA